jgi:hypothetical protein
LLEPGPATTREPPCALATRSTCHTLYLPHALLATRSTCHTLYLPHALLATRSATPIACITTLCDARHHPHHFVTATRHPASPTCSTIMCVPCSLPSHVSPSDLAGESAVDVGGGWEWTDNSHEDTDCADDTSRLRVVHLYPGVGSPKDQLSPKGRQEDHKLQSSAPEESSRLVRPAAAGR